MAQKRMFDKSVVMSDNFLEMPDSCQNLYFHLSMQADDDGFLDNWKSIMRMTGKKEDDFKLLIAKSFIIPFETGVIVIKHWRINNYLRSDRYTETKHLNEKKLLKQEKNQEYSLTNGVGIPTVYTDKKRIGKDSIDKYSKEYNIPTTKSKNFVVPTVEEIKEYCLERKNNIDPNKFFDFYESKGWLVGKNKMKNWKACVRTWEQGNNNKTNNYNTSNKNSNKPNSMVGKYTEEELDEWEKLQWS